MVLFYVDSIQMVAKGKISSDNLLAIYFAFN